MRIPFMPMTFALLFSIFVMPNLMSAQEKFEHGPAIPDASGIRLGLSQEKNPGGRPRVVVTVDDYFKFGVGTTWTYKKTSQHGDGDNGMVQFSTFDAKVTKVGPKGEVFMGEFALYIDGDYLIAGTPAEDGSLVGNLRVMKTGMKAGDTWDGMVAETSEEVKATFVGFEEITTPAGKFQAVHVQYTSKGVTMNFWHVAKVGMVKLTVKTDNFGSEQVLQKYTIK